MWRILYLDGFELYCWGEYGDRESPEFKAALRECRRLYKLVRVEFRRVRADIDG